jgi:thioredoxin 1
MRLIKFSASWCGPCKALTSTIDAIQDKPELLQNMTEIDVDEDPDLTMRFAIRGVPTLVIIDESENVIKRTSGYLSKDKILEFVKV